MEHSWSQHVKADIKFQSAARRTSEEEGEGERRSSRCPSADKSLIDFFCELTELQQLHMLTEEHSVCVCVCQEEQKKKGYGLMLESL